MSDKVCQELLDALMFRLLDVIESGRLDSVELASAYVDQGYINALITHNIFIESEEYEELLEAIISYEGAIS
jgi:hypothetical protein